MEGNIGRRGRKEEMEGGKIEERGRRKGKKGRKEEENEIFSFYLNTQY